MLTMNIFRKYEDGVDFGCLYIRCYHYACIHANTVNGTRSHCMYEKNNKHSWHVNKSQQISSSNITRTIFCWHYVTFCNKLHQYSANISKHLLERSLDPSTNFCWGTPVYTVWFHTSIRSAYTLFCWVVQEFQPVSCDLLESVQLNMHIFPTN